MGSDWIDVRLPTGRQLGRFILWSTGRVVFSGVLFCLDGTSQVLVTMTTLVKWTRGAAFNLIKLYEQLPYAGTPRDTLILDTTATSVLEPEEIITNIHQALEGKHCLIIGDTGTGKSTLAQWLAYQVGGLVTVYDPDATPEEWQGLNVVGRGGNFTAIEAAMVTDLEDLQARVELRGKEGDRALAGKEVVTIAEEFPLLANQVPSAVEWLLSHARRGRKPKKLLIVLSQDDSVKTLGIEGEGGVRRNFRMVRLGKYAIAHAKALKDNLALEWLKSGKFRCMVDDWVCTLPDLSQYKAVTQQLFKSTVYQTTVTAEPSTQQDFSTSELTVTLNSGNDMEATDALVTAIQACLRLGISDSTVIKEVLGYRGGQYQRGKEILEQIKRKI